MSLRSALLGLLEAEPMSGYDLKQVLGEATGYVWSAQHSQIYPTLRQMEKEGLVAADVQRTGDRERRVYRLLDKGRDQLLAWVAEPVAYSAERDPAHLKASMVNLMQPDQAVRFFESHLAHYRQRLAVYEARIAAIRSGESPILRARLRNLPAESHETLVAWKVLSYEGSVLRARAEIEWAERGLAVALASGSASLAGSVPAP